MSFNTTPCDIPYNFLCEEHKNLSYEYCLTPQPER